jgi:hypothetical protein
MARHRALRSTILIVALWVGMRGAYLMVVREVPPVPINAVPASLMARAKTVEGTAVLRVLASHPNFIGLAKELGVRSPNTVSSLRAERSNPVAPQSGLLRSARNDGRCRLSARCAPIADMRVLNTHVTENHALLPNTVSNSVKAVLIQPPEASNQFAAAELLQHQPIDRLSVSAWLLMRGGGGSNSLASNGQLGGSQTGARFIRAVGGQNNAANFGLAARVTSPLGGASGKEVAFGISAKHAKILPLEVIIERRFGLDRSGHNAFALTAVTGISDKPLSGGWRLSAYGQAGIVGAKLRDKFADGALTIERPVWSSTFSLGGGLWGAAQPGVSRLDLGPRIARNIQLGGKNITLAAEWRQRIAGSASPGSGAVLVIGGDF